MSDLQAIVSVYAIFADAEEAERIGRRMIEARHAACVNILGPCISIYRWRGRVEEASEVAAIFKTSASEASALIEAIAKLHRYEVPAAVVWPIEDAAEAYRAWILDSVGG